MRAILPTILTGLILASRPTSAQGADSLPLQAVLLIEGGPQEWWGKDRSSIIAAFGAPDSISIRTLQNRHDTLFIDSIATLHYRGATFVYYVATSLQKDILGEATIWSTRFLTPCPIKLGAPVAQVRAYFGDRSRSSTQRLAYSSDSPLPFKLEMRFENDRLTQLKWAYPVD